MTDTDARLFQKNWTLSISSVDKSVKIFIWLILIKMLTISSDATVGSGYMWASTVSGSGLLLGFEVSV